MFAVTMAGFLGASSVAGAHAGFSVYPGQTQHVFQVAGSHGYQVLVSVGSKTAVLEAIGKAGVVSYTASVKKVGDRFAVRFGRFGKVTMRFDPSGPPSPTTEPQGDCRGRRALVQQGVFRGWFSWSGDRGFSHARGQAIPGMFIRSFKEVCRGTSAAVNEGEQAESIFSTRSIDRHGTREVEVYDLSPSEGFVTARMVEQRPQLQVVRTIAAGVPASSPNPDADGVLSIAPVYPFRGMASLSPGPNGSQTWLGDLEAKFPGRGFVPLVGTSFHIKAVR